MRARDLGWLAIGCGLAGSMLVGAAAWAQAPATGTRAAAPRPADDGVAPLEPLAPVSTPPRKSIAKVTEGITSLPNDQGQVWREYDITPYTLRVTNTKRPEQAIIDWIFRETGYEAWHASTVACLSADNRALRVYHTPDLQSVVADVVDRFVNTDNEAFAFGLRVVALDHPSWRTKMQRMLRSVPVQTPGVEAWLVTKEDATLILAELRKRSEYREHSSPTLLVANGQSTVVASTRARTYARDVVMKGEGLRGFETQMGQIDEGFSLEFSPLLSVDGNTVDAAVKCNIDQVEKLYPVVLEVPTAAAPHQRTQVDVPQISQFRFHERFRWPADQVLVVGLGVVPAPVPSDASPLNLTRQFGFSYPRADLLIFMESKGKTGQAPSATRSADRDTPTYRNRY